MNVVKLEDLYIALISEYDCSLREDYVGIRLNSGLIVTLGTENGFWGYDLYDPFNRHYMDLLSVKEGFLEPIVIDSSLEEIVKYVEKIVHHHNS